jgi:hypothetical protein
MRGRDALDVAQDQWRPVRQRECLDCRRERCAKLSLRRANVRLLPEIDGLSRVVLI